MPRVKYPWVFLKALQISKRGRIIMNEQQIKQYVRSFPDYVEYIWSEINLPQPTPIQRNIAGVLQEGHRRLLIEAFRGIGKTYITGAYATWRLLRNPNEKILIVSASTSHATAISTFIHKLLNTVPLLAHLAPGPDQRNSVMAFDVVGAEVTVQPSVKCLGITSQLQGNRASLLISDDVETSINSATEIMRAKIQQQVNEFDSILQTNADASIIALGTPQTGDSIYNRFAEKGFLTRIWTSRIPENPEVYEGKLAPYIEDMIMNGAKAGDVTDTRFSHQDLLEREGSVGKSYFRLQYQLDTTLSDMEKYPLKQFDMIVMDVDKDKGPLTLSYSSDKRHALDIPNVGFTGDVMHGPGYIDSERATFDFSIMSIDPSGRGADEMGYAIIKYLHGKVYIMECSGIQGGYGEDNLFYLARKAKEYDVNTIYIENNFGDGMFNELLKPILNKVHKGCGIEETRSSKQKELRIIDTVEPLLNQHRLVFDKGMVLRDLQKALEDPNKLSYSLMYQLTHITKQRGSLAHDDRLDALAIGLAIVTEMVGVDEEEMRQSFKDEQFQAELEEWMGGTTGGHWWKNTA
jgi:hypothetical protein